ncbi:hypothetical protein [Phenylobacterium deserti]|uniref:hypothetical protein n=1 Tax=Phenylobacterium deserti TaxID=1914756 RepID=UPI0014040AE6|nr:hypothetical protein [Phenylobacterium deserti]
MSDQSEDPATETAMQRALRMKKAAQDARRKAPDAGKFSPRSAASMSAGASKPWMKK